jgi:hypothetical protein
LYQFVKLYCVRRCTMGHSNKARYGAQDEIEILEILRIID